MASMLSQRLHKVQQAPHPVLCIGNAVVGGSGKTPLAIALNHLLRRKGYRPVFLTRGYGGKYHQPCRVDLAHHTAIDVGDEALLLARHAPTWVGGNRATSAMRARHDGDCYIMDDGMQHPSLKRDITLLAINPHQGVGNHAIMPAGPLREPWAYALAKTQAIVMVEQKKNKKKPPLPPLLHHVTKKPLPIFRATATLDDTQLKNKGSRPLIAFAAIAHPHNFFEMIQDATPSPIIAHYAYPDHAVLTKKQLDLMLNDATQKKATLVTTEKDFVRLPRAYQSSIMPVALRLHIHQEDALLDFVLSSLAQL